MAFIHTYSVIGVDLACSRLDMARVPRSAEKEPSVFVECMRLGCDAQRMKVWLGI